MFSRSIHAVTKGRVSFLWLNDTPLCIYIYMTLSIHSSVYRHLGWLCVLATVNNAAVYLGGGAETASRDEFISFRCIPRSWVVRSCNSSIFNYSRDHCTVFPNGWASLLSHRERQSVFNHTYTITFMCYYAKLTFCICERDFPGGSVVKNLPAMQDMWVPSLGREDPLEEDMATHSSILAWEIPWTEDPSGLQPVGSQKSQTRLGD